MKTITSRDNAQYKELKQLAGSSQARRKAGRTLLDGVHLCQSWIQLRGMPEQCIVSESALANPEVADIVGQLEAQHAHVIALPDALYNARQPGRTRRRPDVPDRHAGTRRAGGAERVGGAAR